MMVQIVYGAELKECQPIITPSEAENCTVTSIWNYTKDSPCNTYTAKVYNINADNIQNFTFIDYGSTGKCFFFWNITEKGSYHYLVNNSDSGEIVVEEAEDNMSSLAIVLFVLTVTGALFILPFIKQFSRFEITNLICERSCWLIAIYLMMLNSAMVATIADSAGLDLTNELFIYMWLFGIVGYLSMVFLVIKTILDTLKLWKIKKSNARDNSDEDEL